MKSRVAILGMLVTGMLFSTAGAGLAVSGIADQSTDNAAVSQYATPTPTPTYDCPTRRTGSASQNQGTGNVTEECGEGGVLPAEAENAPVAARERQRRRRARPGEAPEEPAPSPSASRRPRPRPTQLPFTGFAAIPVLLGGLALLTGGLLLRRRTRSE